MGYLVGKKQDGHTYYYLVESARVDGKPRIVSQQYLGPAEEIAERLAGTSPGEPGRVQVRNFGDLAAVWSTLERLGVREIIDDVVGPRRSDAAASVGTYMALATANRIVAPRSKLAFGKWWDTTTGPRIAKVRSTALDHRRFWDAMDTLSADHLVAAERRITEAMVDRFDLDLSGLVLDMTNFATFVDTANDRNKIAQRGHAKQKRNDLRLVGLGLVVTTDGNIPICSHTYSGSRPDVTQFGPIVDELVARWGTLAEDADTLTLTYDAGQDSIPNQTLIENTPLHFVGSIPPSELPELLAVPKNKYAAVDAGRYPGLTYYETRAKALGADRRLIVTHSPRLADKQHQGFEQTLARATRALDELSGRLARGKTRRSRPPVEADIARILKPRWVSRVVTTTLTGVEPAELRLVYQTDEDARDALEAQIFGKRILFTDHDDWPPVEVVAAYRSQSDVEAGFRQLKDVKVISTTPMFHWTDQKIRVHIFYCVLALATAHLMRREAANAGLEMSVRELLDTLGGIQETTLLYQHNKRGRPRARHMLTDTTPTQDRLYDLFDLDRYAPRR